MFRCVISAVTEIKAAYKCCNLSVTAICLCINEYAFLMVCKSASDDLLFEKAKLTASITRRKDTLHR